ncbi:MAG: hypothetical protein WA660_11025 [Candidatus Acidiferrales bacterium]
MILGYAGAFRNRIGSKTRGAAITAATIAPIFNAILFVLTSATLLSLAATTAARAQATAAPTAAGPANQAKPVPPGQAPIPEQVQANPSAPCVQPAPMVRWQDYDGKFAKTVGVFGRRLERRSVGDWHYKPGAALCTLEVKDKFKLFVEDTLDPLTFVSVGFNAGISQAENSDAKFGQGAQGYGKRFGAAMADQASGYFFKDFLYPTIFSEDPRYYRLGRGTAGQRLRHALTHVVVAHKEDGSQMFNFSEWLGTTSTASLSNLYHPGHRRGFSPTDETVGYSVANDMGFDVLREFWPEIARKFKLPFRGQNQTGN